ncbi:cell surface protein [Flavobacterium artemisiae]|uniref:Cell surface protein n=1 Tax=Flavobacterium artemisiae TaxID=2126556 RepID=A0ABW4HBR9_9FLAO
MKKNVTHFLLAAFLFAFVGCSSDDKPDENANKIEITLQEKYETPTFTVLDINASDAGATAKYEWIMTKNPVDQVTDSIVGNTKDLRFIAIYAGSYEFILNVTSGDKKGTKSTIVNVVNETANYNAYVTRIFDFDPAPGMFANDLFKDGNSKEDVMKTVLGRIDKTSVGYAVDLGGFGGSIVVGFDHTIVNVAGASDFRVYGGDISNPTVPKANPPAPGIIFVAYDKNKNGKPDEDEWYEIIGSQHTKSNTVKNFKITYRKKGANEPLVTSSALFLDYEHVYCENNQEEKYYLARPKAKKEFYPLWKTQTEVSYEGTKLDVDFETARPGQTTLWNSKSPEWGYVNAVNPDIDIDWAVDKNGNKANLPGIDFIKVVNCVSEPMGLCQQQSSMATVFSGAGDLHILKKYNLKQAKN